MMYIKQVDAMRPTSVGVAADGDTLGWWSTCAPLNTSSRTCGRQNAGHI